MKRLIRRSVRAPTMRPAATSLVQCANSTILVKTSPAPIAHSVLHCRQGRTLAADARAPICAAWPDGKASSRFPESGTPRQCPRTVSRSGLSWSNIFFRMWGRADETSVVIRTWLLAPRDAESPDREYSHHPTASVQRTCSSAPQVMSSAACSVRGPVWAAMAWAISISTCVGRTVIGATITSLDYLPDRMSRILNDNTVADNVAPALLAATITPSPFNRPYPN